MFESLFAAMRVKIFGIVSCIVPGKNFKPEPFTLALRATTLSHHVWLDSQSMKPLHVLCRKYHQVPAIIVSSLPQSIFCSQIAIYLRGKRAVGHWNRVSVTFICHCSVRKVCSCGELSPHPDPFVMQTLCLCFFPPGTVLTSHLLRLDSLAETQRWNPCTPPPT